MRTKSAIYNIFTSIIYRIIVIISAMIITEKFIVLYGSNVNGLRSSILQFVGYLNIIELGLGESIIYALYKPLADNNKKKINSILTSAHNSYKTIGYFFTILLFLLALVYPFIINNSSFSYINVFSFVLIIGMSGVINYFIIGKYQTLLYAGQKIYIINNISTISVILNFLLLIVGIFLKIDYILLYFLSLSTILIKAYLIKYYSKKCYNYIDFKEKPDEIVNKNRKDVFTHQISRLLVYNFPVIIITFMFPLTEVSVYVIYANLLLNISTIVQIFGNSLIPGFGDLIASSEKTKIKNAYSDYEYYYYLIVTFVYATTTILGMSFLKIYVGHIQDVNYIRPVLFYLFVIFGIISNFKIPQSSIIISAGHFKETKKYAIIESVITIISIIILGYFYKLNGIILGSTIGVLYRCIDMYYASKITNYKFSMSLKRILRSIGIIIISLLPFIFIVNLEVTSFLIWIINACFVSCWVIFLTITINYLLEPQTFTNIINRIKILIRKKND